MARPPVEWPIPVYTLEIRERVIATYRVPARLLGPRVPSPLMPELQGRHALVSLAFGGARCLKSVGRASALVSEFHLAEVVTPVRWQGACRPTLRGNLLLEVFTDRPALARLLRSALDLEPRYAGHTQGPEQATYACKLDPADGRGARLWLPKPFAEAVWPEHSVFAGQEQAEAALLHPECYFTPDGRGRAAWATPVHQYARATTHLQPAAETATALADLLGAAPEEVMLDHVLFQKRCTHTWSFPPERIPLTRQALPATAFQHPHRLAA